MRDDDYGTVSREVLFELSRLSELTKTRIDQQNSLVLALRNGIIAGLGGAIGASVAVAILVSLLQPFDDLAVIKDALNRLSQQENWKR